MGLIRDFKLKKNECDNSQMYIKKFDKIKIRYNIQSN